MVVWDTHLPNGCVGRQAFPMVALVLKLPNPRDGSSSKIIGLAELVQIRYKSRSRRECTVHSAFTVSGIHALLPVIRDWRLVTSGGANASAASWRRSAWFVRLSRIGPTRPSMFLHWMIGRRIRGPFYLSKIRTPYSRIPRGPTSYLKNAPNTKA